MSFSISNSGFSNVLLVKSDIFRDDRGLFSELYREHEIQSFLGVKFVQDNYSLSRQGVVRGLHYQTDPHGQGKFLRVLSGRIFDVVVDIRPYSPTFKQWFSWELNDTSGEALYIPEGFAHGFCALSPEAVVYYKVTNYFSASSSRCILWNDPSLNINWPDAKAKKIVSEQDSKGSLLTVLNI